LKYAGTSSSGIILRIILDIEQTLFPALTKMFGGYGNIVKSDYKKPFKIFFESPLFHDTVVEILDSSYSTFYFTKCHKTFFIVLKTKLRNPY
jgi:hypothetical protein